MGEYRAPKSRTALRDYWWFCLEHVRAYNAGWDYCKGMSVNQIEAELRADTIWQRPTWPLGRNGGGIDPEHVHDPLDLLERTRTERVERHRSAEKAREKLPPELVDALLHLGLTWPVTLDVVKTRYKELAKTHHPDTNGGDLAAEARFKVINLAYATLRNRLAADRVAAAG